MSLNKKVLISFNGGSTSVVSAYLLKKQGMDCHTVYVSFNYQKETSLILKAKELSEQYLNIPFSVIDATEYFYELIIIPYVDAKLMGEVFNIQLACIKLLINLVANKAKELDKDLYALGLFAKVLHFPENNRTVIDTPADLRYDQSYYLSTISQENLAHLELPLSDIYAEEMTQIVTKGNYPVFENSIDPRKYVNLDTIIKKQVAPSLYRKGVVINKDDNQVISSHDGIHNFTIGQRGLTIGERYFPLYITEIDFNTGTIYASSNIPKYLGAMGKNASFVSSIDLSIPFLAEIRLSPLGEFIPVTIWPKNNGYILLEFTSIFNRAIIGMGQLVVIYKSSPQKLHRIIGYTTISRAIMSEKDDVPIRDLIDRKLQFE